MVCNQEIAIPSYVVSALADLWPPLQLHVQRQHPQVIQGNDAILEGESIIKGAGFCCNIFVLLLRR